MSQLSKPYQYALVAMIVLAGAWFTVLKPSDDVAVDAPLPAAAAPPATAPGVQGLTTAVDEANAAVDEANPAGGAAAPANPAVPGADAAPAAPVPAAKKAAEPTTTTGDPSRPILDAVGSGKVAVVLFYEAGGADDRAVRRSLQDLPRRGGRVAVFSARIGDVGRYAAITRGVSVLSAPTVLVIDADRVASSITGFTEVGEIDQLVGDALKRTVAADAAPAAPGAA